MNVILVSDARIDMLFIYKYFRNIFHLLKTPCFNEAIHNIE